GESDDDGAGPAANAFVAVMLFIGADFMFFAGLIGAFLVFRFGVLDWPPPDQPRLPVAVTGLNTTFLLVSGYTMLRTWRHLTHWTGERVFKSLAITSLLGTAFLLGQGYEWVRLLRFGLTLSSSVYGGIFYVLIGCHALHVLAAVVWLGAVVAKLKFRPPVNLSSASLSIKLAGMYWLLVVGLWPLLYGLVYLS
ncbi:MAG: hypothetical protein D6743_02510, partial [Calditrichaeota bacterium]